MYLAELNSIKYGESIKKAVAYFQQIINSSSVAQMSSISLKDCLSDLNVVLRQSGLKMNGGSDCFMYQSLKSVRTIGYLKNVTLIRIEKRKLLASTAEIG